MKNWWWLISISVLVFIQLSCNDRGFTGKKSPAGISSETFQESTVNEQQGHSQTDSVISTDKQIRDNRQKFEAPRHEDPEQNKIDSIKRSKSKH